MAGCKEHKVEFKVACNHGFMVILRLYIMVIYMPPASIWSWSQGDYFVIGTRKRNKHIFNTLEKLSVQSSMQK